MISKGTIVFWIICMVLILVCLALMTVFEIQYRKRIREIEIDRLKRIYGEKYWLFTDEKKGV